MAAHDESVALWGKITGDSSQLWQGPRVFSRELAAKGLLR